MTPGATKRLNPSTLPDVPSNNVNVNFITLPPWRTIERVRLATFREPQVALGRYSTQAAVPDGQTLPLAPLTAPSTASPQRLRSESIVLRSGHESRGWPKGPHFSRKYSMILLAWPWLTSTSS
jgi:hypothetical protein